MDLSVLRRTAAEIAAAAVYELYPDVELWGGDETSTGFFYEFYFPHPIHLHIIEERMRQIVREKRPIRTLEMVPFSASELLKKEGHQSRAQELEEEGLVEIIQIGAFHDLSPGPHLKNTAELAAFKISADPLPEKGMRLTGWCHRSKEQLKEYLKMLDNYIEPVDRGEKMGFWKGPIWLPEGLKARNMLIQYLKSQWFEGAYEILSPFDADRTVVHRSLNKPKVAEIWSAAGETHIQVSFFGEEMISSLQSIAKTLTILGFDHSTVSRGPVTDYVVVDGLGRNSTLVRVKKEASAMVFTATIEKIFSLLLEKNLILQMVNIEN